MPMMSPMQGQQPQGPTQDQAKQLFDQGLSDMAHNVLVNKLPNIANDVVTFKILDTDPDKGSGVGAFVVVRHGQTLYIPVVMADNQIKPMDLMYYKDLNVFLPLTKDWLAELDKMAVEGMGSAQKPPQTMSTDVDIRNVVVPPTTGRYSYAAEQDAGRWVDEARNQDTAASNGGFFLDFISAAPNTVKTAVAKLFETHPKMLKKAVEFYGENRVVTAFVRHPEAEKVADYGHKLSKGGGLYIADSKTTAGEFKDMFGPEAPIAFQGTRVKGFYAKDTRKKLHRPVHLHGFQDLQETKSSGAYKVWKQDGTATYALVVPNPLELFSSGSDDGISPIGKKVGPRNERLGYRPSGNYHGTIASSVESHDGGFVGVDEEGKLIHAHRPLIGDQVEMAQLLGSKVFKKTVTDSEAGPRVGQAGIFVLRQGDSFVATHPVKIKSITNKDDVRRIVVTQPGPYAWGERALVSYTGRGGKIVVPSSIDAPVILPRDAAWVPVSNGDKPLTEHDFMSNPKDVLCWAEHGLADDEASKMVVKKSSAHGYSFGNKSREAFDFVPALRKLALDANLSVDDAEHILKLAEEKGRVEFWSLADDRFEKVSSYFAKAAGEDGPPKKKEKSGGGGDPSGGGDPAGDAMGAVPGAPVAPQMPTPVDMAVAEQMQNLQMQMQGIQAQMTVLQNVAQRANMIAGVGGVMGAPGAAAAAMAGPMDPSMMGAGAAPAQQGGAPQGGQPGAQPGMAPQQGGMGQQPAPGVAMMGQPQPGPAMAQGGGPQAGMSPMAGAGQQQMDPNGGGQAPGGATMTADDGSIDSIMQQVNPQFVDQAGALNDAGIFDAAALSSMAQAPALKDLVGSYMPNLEKALDNVGRMLLTLWMDEVRIKQDIGDETYIAIEDNLRMVLRGLGELILKVNQNSMVLRGPHDQSFEV